MRQQLKDGILSRPLLGAGLVVLMIQGCAIAGVSVSGRVIDVESGDPISGAYVYAESGHDNIRLLDSGGPSYTIVDAALTRTDQDGYYRFGRRFRFGATLASKFGHLIVYKPGYTTAPQMVAKNWESDVGETPQDYIAHHIPAQYFYGTGDYLDNYTDLPLNSTHRAYYLSSRPVAELYAYSEQRRSEKNLAPGFKARAADSLAQPRIRYLDAILGQITGPDKPVCILGSAIYQEASKVANTSADRKKTAEIRSSLVGCKR